MTGQTVTARPARRGTARIAGGLAAAAVIATALNTAVAAAARAAGASAQFSPLRPQAYAALTVIGILAGAAGWAFARARSASPGRLLRVLVPAVLLASFLPDVLVGVSGAMTGTSWRAVAALMSMHVVVAAVAVPAYLRILPLPASRRPARPAGRDRAGRGRPGQRPGRRDLHAHRHPAPEPRS